MEIIKYASGIDVASGYTVTPIPTVATTAFTVLDLDVDSTSVASVGGNTQATLYIDYTVGSLTSCDIIIYSSYVGNPADTDWYQETQESDSSGVATLYPFKITLGNADLKIDYHFPIGAVRAIKVAVQASGTNTSSALTLNLGLRSN